SFSRADCRREWLRRRCAREGPSGECGMQAEGLGRREIVWLAVLFEGGLAVLACLIGWSAGLPPWATLAWDLRDAALGVAASVPMLALLAACVLAPWRPLARIRQFVD